MKRLHFIAGLPRSGSTMITNILKQNPDIHGAAVSSLSAVFSAIFMNWDSIEANKEYENESAKLNVLKAVLENYHNHINKSIVFDKDRSWISKIALLETLYDKPAKMLICVRNPAEILSSFEKIRKHNPTKATLSEFGGEGATIASRAMFFSGPGGALGAAHAQLKDAITMGYLDRLLFVDYNRFCNSPKGQLKRIYEFFEIPEYTHDLNNITQEEIYNDQALHLPNLHKIKPKLDKTTVNCVEYLGLDLYEQYNSEIFWDAWI